MNPLIQLKKATPLFLVVSMLVCLAVSHRAQAVSPAPDGGYPRGNTAEGQRALLNLTTGQFNSALGFLSLSALTTGNFCTGVGAGALLLNTADGNTAVGAAALLSNTIGSGNTATGLSALGNNINGTGNTANGYQALNRNTTGSENTATGFQALYSNTGTGNTANGYQALFSNTTGSYNTAIGNHALVDNTTGDYNTTIGANALFSNTTGRANTAIGVGAGFSTTGDGNVCIGVSVFGVAGVNNTTWISNIYTTVQPVVGTDPDYVTVDSSGRLGRGNISSRRYKHDIKPMDNASEAILALKPVTFRYNKEFDATQTLAFGLIAEDVAEVYPDLVGRNREGQPESVRYEQLNAMLLNEFLKEHRKVQEQEASIRQLRTTAAKQEATVAQQRKDFEATTAHQQKQIQALTASLTEQAAQIQKVSAELAAASPSRGGLEASKRAPQVVVSNP